MVAGAYEFDSDALEPNIRPKDIPDAIPEDQRALHHGIYEVRNVLKLLESRGFFAKETIAIEEFRGRLHQVAEVGLTAENVKMKQAAEALVQIREDIVRRKGRRIKYRYLVRLAAWAAGGAVVGFGIIAAEFVLPGLRGYGWVVAGSMAGAWLSLAATRREISFEHMQSYVDFHFEPLVRMLFVGSLAAVFALFLQLKVLSLTIGTLDLMTFPDNTGGALLLGLFTGISERAVSVRVLDSARKVIAPGST